MTHKLWDTSDHSGPPIKLLELILNLKFFANFTLFFSARDDHTKTR